VLQSGVPVTASVATGGGTLGGTLLVNTDAVGRATFTDLRLNGPVGPRTLSFTSPNLTSVISAAVSLAPGTPAALAITTQPSSATSNVIIAPAIGVNIIDADGNVMTSSNAQVTIASNPGNVSLTGTAGRTFASGSVSFNDLKIDKAGIGYTLTFTSGNLSTTSIPFKLSGGEERRIGILSGGRQRCRLWRCGCCRTLRWRRSVSWRRGRRFCLSRR
jgi:hypothetical protein